MGKVGCWMFDMRSVRGQAATNNLICSRFVPSSRRLGNNDAMACRVPDEVACKHETFCQLDNGHLADILRVIYKTRTSRAAAAPDIGGQQELQ